MHNNSKTSPLPPNSIKLKNLNHGARVAYHIAYSFSNVLMHLQTEAYSFSVADMDQQAVNAIKTHFGENPW